MRKKRYLPILLCLIIFITSCTAQVQQRNDTIVTAKNTFPFGVQIDSQLFEPVKIVDDQEIILHAIVFSNDNGASIESNMQKYAKEPELIKKVPVLYLVKCKF